MVQTLLGELTEFTRAFQETDHIKINNFLRENGGEWILWKKKAHHYWEAWEEFGNARFKV